MNNNDDAVLLTRADIARYAGVGRAAVTNWLSRHVDFPEPAQSIDLELFDAAAVAGWLDGRKIPASGLAEGESEGQSYGRRFRRNLNLPLVGSAPPRSEQEVVREAVKQLLAQVGRLPSERTVGILATLIYIEGRHPRLWVDLKKRCRYENGWHLLEDVWRKAMQWERTDSIPLPFAVLDGTPTGSWSVTQLVAAVDDACNVLSNESQSGLRHILSAKLFSTLMWEYVHGLGRRSREFFTPPSLTRLAVDLLDPFSHATERIYDPFCRMGEFLVEVAARSVREASGHGMPHMWGRHPSIYLCSLARMNLSLYGVESDIRPGYWWDRPIEQEEFGLIFANPPFLMRMPESMMRDQRWMYGAPPVSNGDYAWLQYILTVLRPEGRAAVVMSNNAVFSTRPRERAIRASMVEDGAVECVVALPAGLFSGTSIPVTLWLLRKPRGVAAEMLFIDAKSLGSGVARAARHLSDGDIGHIVDAYRRWSSGESVNIPGFARSVSIAEVRSHDHMLMPGAYVELADVRHDPSIERIRVAEAQRRSFRLQKRLRQLDPHVEELTKLLEERERMSGGWPTIALGDLCSLKAGPSVSYIRAEVKPGNGVPILLPRHIRGGRIVEDDIVLMPQEAVAKLAGYRLQVDDLVCVRTGEVGRVAKVGESQEGWLFSTGIVRMRARERVVPAYLLHVLASQAARDLFSRHSTGTVVPAITRSALAKMPVAVPPLSEQTRIASLFDALSEQTHIYEQLAGATESIGDAVKRGIFNSSGGVYHHPGCNFLQGRRSIGLWRSADDPFWCDAREDDVDGAGEDVRFGRHGG